MTNARYVLDENVAEYLLIPLRRAGLDVMSLAEAGRKGLGDEHQLTWAAGERRVIITHDRDFTRLARTTSDHSGVAYCSQKKYHSRPGDLIRRIVQLHTELAAEDWANRVVFL